MSKLQTLEEFLAATEEFKQWPRNAYVKAPGFKELYVRRTHRYLNDEWIERVLDIARIEAKKPGKGAFTNLVSSLLERGIPLYVECVQNERFIQKLKDMGFTCVPHSGGSPSFFKLPGGKKPYITWLQAHPHRQHGVRSSRMPSSKETMIKPHDSGHGLNPITNEKEFRELAKVLQKEVPNSSDRIHVTWKLLHPKRQEAWVRFTKFAYNSIITAISTPPEDS